jgi:hypothetical protein
VAGSALIKVSQVSRLKAIPGLAELQILTARAVIQPDPLFVQVMLRGQPGH